jgi:hypothetical protein
MSVINCHICMGLSSPDSLYPFKGYPPKLSILLPLKARKSCYMYLRTRVSYFSDILWDQIRFLVASAYNPFSGSFLGLLKTKISYFTQNDREVRLLSSCFGQGQVISVPTNGYGTCSGKSRFSERRHYNDDRNPTFSIGG